MLPRESRNMRSLRHLVVDWDHMTKLFMGGMPAGIGELTRLETLDLFVVSPPNKNSRECGVGIQELGRLNQLKGTLVIKGLRHVVNPSDAQKANLRSKSNLSVLNLYWSDSIYDDVESSSNFPYLVEEEVLEGLQPQPNIHTLSINRYPGAVLPSWLRDSLPNIISLELRCLPNVEGLLVLPPCLVALFIINCPKLRLPTTLPCSIKNLSVERCNDPSLSSVETLPHLLFLRIGGFDEQETLPKTPLRILTRLQDLWIVDCGKLKRLPTELENLATIDKLVINNCGELESMTEEGLRNLTSLKELKIFNCRSLKSLAESLSSLQHLTSLHTLYLDGCPDLEISAVDFHHLVSLRVLSFGGLPQLTCLPEGIQHVTTLQDLMIVKCKNLRMLPEWLQHQPPALCYLEILECHLDLHRRCEKDKGEDWHKISDLRVVNKEESYIS